MSQDSHEVLEECSNKAKQLVSEIEKFQKATAIQESVAKNLFVVATQIKNVADQIRPLQTKSFRRFKITMIIIGASNLVLLVLLSLLVLKR